MKAGARVRLGSMWMAGMCMALSGLASGAPASGEPDVLLEVEPVIHPVLADSTEPMIAAPDSLPQAKKGRPLIQISPIPGPNPQALAAEGKVVRGVTVSGNRITKEYVITRELQLAAGQPFRVETMAADTRRLDNLGIFSSVAIVPQPVAGDQVDVDVAVREMPWIIPYVAFRISDQAGVSVGPAASSMNLFGRDIALSGRVLFGGASTYQLNLDWPWITGDHVSLNLVAMHLIRDDDVREFEETSDEVTAWIGTYLGEATRLKGGFSYFHLQSDTDGITLTPDNSDNLLRLGAGAGYDTRDSWVNPHEGLDLELQVMRTGGFLGGDADFWTTDLDLVRYQPLGRHTLVLSGLTSIQTTDDQVPVYLDYLMGGSNSIRGYQLTELGKELAGRNQLILTFEYQHLVWPVREVIIYGFPITLGIEAAAFMDVGMAWDHFDTQFDSDHARTGFGFGLRPLFPGVGEVRLDLGFGTDGEVVFNVATSPKMVAQRLRLR